MRARPILITSVAAAVMLTGTACTGFDQTGFFGTTDASEPPPSEAPEASAPPSEPTDQVSAILVQPIQDALVVLGSDEMEHVEYELLVVNVFSDPVTLTGVTVIGPDGEELQQVEGDTLEAATQELFTKAASSVVAPSAAVSVDVDLILPPGEVPARVTHRIDYTLPDDSAGAVIVDDTVVHGPEVAIDRTDATVISPPVAGDDWVVTTACCTPNVHRDLRLAIDGRRIATAETFAVDWARMVDDRLYEGDGSRNEQYYTFGEELYAVADGTVVAINEGVAESAPLVAQSPDAKTGFGGNYVIIEIDDDVYAAYEHVQADSITVAVGDTVATGDVIGKLGNTGPSLGPHLHFGLLDRPDLFAGRSLPFVIDEFTMVGTLDFDASEGDRLVITPASGTLQEVYPLHGTVQDFD
jgi:hypothetical protein